ncbi:MAG: hypothetical protein ACUVXI_15540 [bacterium]
MRRVFISLSALSIIIVAGCSIIPPPEGSESSILIVEVNIAFRYKALIFEHEEHFVPLEVYVRSADGEREFKAEVYSDGIAYVPNIPPGRYTVGRLTFIDGSSHLRRRYDFTVPEEFRGGIEAEVPPGSAVYMGTLNFGIRMRDYKLTLEEVKSQDRWEKVLSILRWRWGDSPWIELAERRGGG